MQQAIVPRVTLTALPGIPDVRAGDDVAHLIGEALGHAAVTLEEDDILVVAHKIISKAEGQLVRLRDVQPSDRARELAAVTGKEARYLQVVLDEAVRVERARRGVIVTEQRGGWIVANSAIDQSNVEADADDPVVLLLPRDPDASARALRERLYEMTGARTAIIINDTHGRPFRLGAVGVAIGVAGLEPLVDLRGKQDLYGYTLQSTEIAIADEIASAASLLQGQTNQGTPVVHIRGLTFTVDEAAMARTLQRPRALDMFR